jgi:hypothetical protein
MICPQINQFPASIDKDIQPYVGPGRWRAIEDCLTTEIPAQLYDNNKNDRFPSPFESITLNGQQQDITRSVFFQPPDRRSAAIGGMPLGAFLLIFNFLRKKGEIDFKMGGIG